MYSEADRLHAIELYFKYGKKIVAVFRELGYPTERHLRRWIEAWNAGDGTVKNVKRKPRYSTVQKPAAVDHYLTHGRCLAFTCRELG